MTLSTPPESPLLLKSLLDLFLWFLTLSTPPGLLRQSTFDLCLLLWDCFYFNQPEENNCDVFNFCNGNRKNFFDNSFSNGMNKIDIHVWFATYLDMSGKLNQIVWQIRFLHQNSFKGEVQDWHQWLELTNRPWNVPFVPHGVGQPNQSKLIVTFCLQPPHGPLIDFRIKLEEVGPEKIRKLYQFFFVPKKRKKNQLKILTN